MTGPWKCPQCGDDKRYTVSGAKELHQGQIHHIECDICGWGEELPAGSPHAVLARIAGTINVVPTGPIWNYEAVEGIFKNHQLSERLLQQALAETMAMNLDREMVKALKGVP